ncbi:MAG: hypothetical protein ACTS2F_27835 [Thainema sp.]
MTGQEKSATLLAQLRAIIQASTVGTGADDAYLLPNPAPNQPLQQNTVPRLDGLPTAAVYQLGAIASISALSVATGHWLQPESIPLVNIPTDTDTDPPGLTHPDLAQPDQLYSTQTVAAPENLPTASHQVTNPAIAGVTEPSRPAASAPVAPSPQQQQLAALQAQTPVLQQQLASLRNELRSLQQQHGLTNIAIDVQRFAVRLDNLATQQSTLHEKLALAQQQQAELLQQINISSHSQIGPRILNNNARYRALLDKLNAIDQQLINTASQVTPNTAQLQTLQQQYQAHYTQLNQEAVRSLQFYAKSSGSTAAQQPIYVSAEMIQESAYLRNLQQAIELAHRIQVLQMRQQNIATAAPQIHRRQQQMISLMQEYDSLTQQIKTTSVQLDQNLNQIAMLETTAPVNADSSLELAKQ